MTSRSLTATHTQILRTLTWNSFKSKHINYVVKCLGYKDCKESTFVYSCLIALKNRHLARMEQQFADDPLNSYWYITEKGKVFLDNQ